MVASNHSNLFESPQPVIERVDSTIRSFEIVCRVQPEESRPAVHTLVHRALQHATIVANGRSERIQREEEWSGFVFERALKAGYCDDAPEVIPTISGRCPRVVDNHIAEAISLESILHGKTRIVHRHGFL